MKRIAQQTNPIVHSIGREGWGRG